jgi:ribonuclease HI
LECSHIPPQSTHPDAPPLLLDYHTNLPLKFPPLYSYYTNGSFEPPKKKQNGTWLRERAGYGIYNPCKDIQISERLPGLQNILRAELLAIHHTLQIITEQFPNEPAYIFIDSLTLLYLLISQLKHPTHHNNHPDQTILKSMIHMLSQRIQSTIITKIKAHANIAGNKHADKLAKDGNKLPDRSPLHPYEKAHPIPYYFHRNHWPSMEETPEKGPIRHLQPYLQKHENKYSLKYIAQHFPNISKWTNNSTIDNDTSNTFWSHVPGYH